MKPAEEIADFANELIDNYLKQCECSDGTDVAKVCTPIILAFSQEIQTATDGETAHGILQLVLAELIKNAQATTSFSDGDDAKDVENIIKGLSYLESGYSHSETHKRLYFTTVLKYAMGSLKRELGSKETKKTVKALLEKLKTHTKLMH